MKKSLVIIGFIFTILIAINNYSQAAGSVSLSSNKNSVYVGDEFSISVNLSGASVATLTTKITIDTSKVEYVSGPSNSNFSNGRVIYTWTDPNGGSSPISSGTIATFRFRAKGTGTANFSVTGDFYDASENPVKPSFSGKSVTISEVPTTNPPTNTTGGGTSTGGGNISTPSTNTGGNTGNTGSNTPTSSASTNAFLKSLQLNVEGISPKFSRNTTQYYITVSNLVSFINVNATPESSSAKVTVSGNTGIKTGMNKISILVTAQDGKTKKTYTINVTKTDDPSKANANLENLAIENCTLTPEFNSDITEYTCDLEADLTTLNILAVPQNQNSKTEIIGNENLQIGENNIQVNVTAPDGVTVKTYSIKVNKKDVSNLADEPENDENLQNEDTFVEPKKVNKNGAVIPLSIAGIVAIIGGICYKKFKKV